MILTMRVYAGLAALHFSLQLTVHWWFPYDQNMEGVREKKLYLYKQNHSHCSSRGTHDVTWLLKLPKSRTIIFWFSLTRMLPGSYGTTHGSDAQTNEQRRALKWHGIGEQQDSYPPLQRS